MANPKITLQQFRKAMQVVKDYAMQIEPVVKKSAKEIGCKVVLSEFGRESLKTYSKPHNKEGVVIDWLNWHSTPTFEDGLVTVKWEGIAEPDVMHISHVKPIE